MNKTVFSKNKIKLRYDNLWKTIFIFSLPTVFIVAMTALYPIFDKFIVETTHILYFCGIYIFYCNCIRDWTRDENNYWV